MLRIDDASPATTFEYVECTGVSGTTLTVTRGQEGTTGIAHSAGAFVGNDLTAAMIQRAFPLGVLSGGRAIVTTTQGSITTAVDLTGLTITVTPAAGRLIKVSFQLHIHSTVSGDVAGIFIQEGTTVLGQSYQGLQGVNFSQIVTGFVLLTPTNAAHTYKLTAQRITGTGTLQTDGSASFPEFILAEDIGPA
jgi:hypothetical protein